MAVGEFVIMGLSGLPSPTCPDWVGRALRVVSFWICEGKPKVLLALLLTWGVGSWGWDGGEAMSEDMNCEMGA